MEDIQIIEEELTLAQEVLDHFRAERSNLLAISKAADMLVDAVRSGNKIITCGNGGSHAHAMHFAEELTGRFRNDRPPIPAIAIADPTHISCVGNDYGYDYVFSRYVEALGNKGDILIGLSTSGQSKNVINAFRKANEKEMSTLALTGKDGGELAQLAVHEIRISHEGYADRIQEMHMKIIHIIIQLMEQKLF